MKGTGPFHPWTAPEARPGGRNAEQLAADIVALVVDGIGAYQRPTGR